MLGSGVCWEKETVMSDDNIVNAILSRCIVPMFSIADVTGMHTIISMFALPKMDGSRRAASVSEP